MQRQRVLPRLQGKLRFKVQRRTQADSAMCEVQKVFSKVPNSDGVLSAQEASALVRGVRSCDQLINRSTGVLVHDANRVTRDGIWVQEQKSRDKDKSYFLFPRK